MNYEKKFGEIEKLYQEGEVDKSLVLLQKFEQQTEKQKNMEILIKIWQWLIVLYQHQGKLDKAIIVANKALKQMKDDTSKSYCDILRRRGFVYYLKGNVEQFLSDVNFALKIARQNKYEKEEAACLGVLGIYYQQTKHDFKKALECYQKAIKIKRRLCNKESAVKLMINLGTLYKEMKKFDESRRLFDEALQITKEKRLKINCYLEIGSLFCAQGDISKAKEKIDLALKLALSTKFTNEQGDCYRELARVSYKENKKKKVRNSIKKPLKFSIDTVIQLRHKR